MQKLVIYTVLTGTKEPLGNPVADLLDDTPSDLAIEFFCITDNPDLKSDIWQFILLDESLILPPEKLSRHPKCHPHHYFPDHQYSLFIDNIVKFKRLPCEADLQVAADKAPLFKVFTHFYRQFITEEALAIAGLKYDASDVLAKQLAFYKTQISLDDISPLTTGTVLLRQHHHPKIKMHGDIWWLQILQFSKRDQMSFDFAVKKSDLQLSYFAGMKNNSDLIHKPHSMGGRVRASFDSEKYKWLHRRDPLAQADPKAHFLAQGALGHERYEVDSDEFDLMCFLVESSLGSKIAPRRRIAMNLQAILKRYMGLSTHIQFVCLFASEPQGMQYDEQEVSGVLQSLFALAKRNRVQGEIDLKNESLAQFNFQQAWEVTRPYGLVAFLGYPVVEFLQLPLVLKKVLAVEQTQSLILHFDQGVDVMALAWLKQQLLQYKKVHRFEIMASAHDSLEESVAQSLLFIVLSPK